MTITIASEWESYVAAAVPPDASSTQKIETRRAFYAGAHSTLHALISALPVDRSEIELLFEELAAFVAAVEGGSA